MITDNDNGELTITTVNIYDGSRNQPSKHSLKKTVLRQINLEVENLPFLDGLPLGKFSFQAIVVVLKGDDG